MQILEEYRRVLLELAEKTRTSTPTNQILELIELYAQMVDPASFSTSVCDDPDDDKFLEAAVAANADYVVSGDKALLRIRKYGGTQIVNPSQFLRILAH